MSPLTTEQAITLTVIFIAGLVIGLLMRPGGPKWRKRYEDERAAHMALVRKYETEPVRAAEPRSTVIPRI